MPCAYLHPAQGVAQPQSLAGCVMDVRAAGAPRGDQVVVQLWGGPWWCTLLGEGHGGALLGEDHGGALFLGRAMVVHSSWGGPWGRTLEEDHGACQSPALSAPTSGSQRSWADLATGVNGCKGPESVR